MGLRLIFSALLGSLLLAAPLLPTAGAIKFDLQAERYPGSSASPSACRLDPPAVPPADLADCIAWLRD